MRIETKQSAQIVHLLCEGVGIRSISRLTGVCQETVLRVLSTAGEQCVKVLDAINLDETRFLNALQGEVGLISDLCVTVEDVHVDDRFRAVIWVIANQNRFRQSKAHPE